MIATSARFLILAVLAVVVGGFASAGTGLTASPAARAKAKPVRYAGTTALGWRVAFETPATRNRIEKLRILVSADAGDKSIGGGSCRSGGGVLFFELKLWLSGSARIARNGSFTRGFSAPFPAMTFVAHGSTFSMLLTDTGRISGAFVGALHGSTSASGTLTARLTIPATKGGAADTCSLSAIPWSARVR